MGEPSRLNIAFFGSGAFGLPTLRYLAEHHRVLAVFTQPDRPAGRKRKLTPTPVGAWAAEHLPDVPLYKPSDVNDAEHGAALRQLPLGRAHIDDNPASPEVRPVATDRTDGEPIGAAVVIAFGQKLGAELMRDRLFVNLHASRLPRWRGAAPINHAILAGDRLTGNSVITLADRMDAGLVLGTSERPIGEQTTTGDLHDALADDGPLLIERVLRAYAAGSLEPVVQDESGVTIAGKLTKAMGRADVDGSPIAFVRRVQAFNPWPAVTATFRGEPIKLLRASLAEQPAGVAAEAAGVDAEEQVAEASAVLSVEPGGLLDSAGGVIRVGAGADAGAVRLLEVQPAGGTALSWAAFANGVRPRVGERFTAPDVAKV
jgi:methionyl-tRNA formyltransferase